MKPNPLVKLNHLTPAAKSTLHDSAPFIEFYDNPEPWPDGIERVCSETMSDMAEAGSEPRFGIVSSLPNTAFRLMIGRGVIICGDVS